MKSKSIQSVPLMSGLALPPCIPYGPPACRLTLSAELVEAELVEAELVEALPISPDPPA